MNVEHCCPLPRRSGLQTLRSRRPCHLSRGLRVSAVLQTKPSSQQREPKAAYLENLFEQSLSDQLTAGMLPSTRTDTLGETRFANSPVDVEVLDQSTPSSSSSDSSSNNGSKHQLQFGHVHVFCYGVNMGISALHKRNVLKVVSRDPATVVDPNVHLLFKHQGGRATLAALPPGVEPKYRSFDDKVHGVLYQMSREAMKKLQAREGGYSLSRVLVKTYDGEFVDAYVFVSSHMATLVAEVPPTEAYMRQLRQGASDNYLDPAYQAFLSSIETVTSAGLPFDYYNTPTKYFVLGWVMLVATATIAFVLRAH